MSLKEQLIAALPPFENNWELISKKQPIKGIISEILDAHDFFENDYDKIYSFFLCDSINDTCYKLWDFQRNNLEYVAEIDDQNSKSPAAILQMPDDCKHFALFTSGVLSAIQRNERVNWDWFYRFASDTEVNFVTHVFIVVEDNGKSIWVDPCIRTFNKHISYLITDDRMPIYRISGVQQLPASKPNTVIVDKAAAFQNFLYMMGKDMLVLKTLMKNTPAVTNGPVAQYFISQGFDWPTVLNYINS